MKVAAVIVTYNRLELLKECVSQVKKQTIPAQQIFVVNNSSTDGTTEWLKDQAGITVINQPNKGGSWGFYEGIKVAFEHNHDWIWLMDDDTIPNENTLEELLIPLKALEKTADKPIGFISSKVNWTNSSPHLMNVPILSGSDVGNKPFNRYDEFNVLSVKSSSFVSLIINRKVIPSVGLPYKEFFIWEDDVEYTSRITQAGNLGFYASKSVVTHKTPVNYAADIYTDSVANIWKHKYGIRNKLFFIKKSKGNFKFFTKLLKTIFIIPIRICKKRKNDKLAFVKANFDAAVSSINFNPKIDFLK